MDTAASGKLRNLTSIYLLKGNQILLLYRQGSRVVNNVWVSSAGGHFEEDELNDARKCVLRELKEELNLNEHDLESIHMRYVTLYHNSKDLRQNYYFFARLKDHASIDLTSNEGTVSWFDLDQISTLDMPFTSKWVMNHYVKEGQFTHLFYAGVSSKDRMYFHELSEFD